MPEQLNKAVCHYIQNYYNDLEIKFVLVKKLYVTNNELYYIVLSYKSFIA